MSDGFEQLFLRRPDSMEQMIEEMTPDIYANLKSAIELGKYSDGSRLSPEQIDFSMQALILYESKKLPQSQRTGVDLTARCASKQAGNEASNSDVESLNFVKQDQQP